MPDERWTVTVAGRPVRVHGEMRRTRIAVLGALAAIAASAAATVLPLSAAADSCTRLVATGVRADINSTAYVRVVIGFSGASVGDGGVTLTAVTHPSGDPSTVTGATLFIGARCGASAVGTATGYVRYGIHVSVRPAAGGLTVTLRFERRYKYVQYRVADSGHLEIKMWHAGPPGAASYIPNGSPPRCLTFRHTIRRPGRITATGTESNVFEHQFQLGIRGADGRRLSSVHVTAIGGTWTATVPYTVTHAQWGTLEATAFSPKDGSLTCIAQLAVMLVPR